MKTQYYVASSLDGFIAAPGDDLTWLTSLGSLEETGYPDFIRDVGALAMGSRSYEWMLRNVIAPPQGEPAPWPYEQPTWIFTTRALPTVEGADLRFVRGAVQPVHAAMRAAAGSKNLWLVGGGELVARFHDEGLLDELIVQVSSVTLGAGSPLLPRTIVDPPLRLTSARAMGEAFAELRYDVRRPAQ